MKTFDINNPPKKIYLQVDPDNETENGKFPLPEEIEITWCQDKINETDIEYISTETQAELLETLNKLEDITQTRQQEVFTLRRALVRLEGYLKAFESQRATGQPDEVLDLTLNAIMQTIENIPVKRTITTG